MDVFEALADPVRRALLAEVSIGPRRVVDLAARRLVRQDQAWVEANCLLMEAPSTFIGIGCVEGNIVPR